MVVVLIVLASLLFLSLGFLFFQNTRIAELLRSTHGQFQSQEKDAAVKQSAFETSLKGLEDKLRAYELLLRDWERDRAEKYGQLEKELSHASQATSRLESTTNNLTNILGNVKLRGQWGERMAEDVIRYAGLLENINYKKQTANSTGTRPDFIFLLPDERTVNLDVKFPLDNYLKMVNAEGDLEKEAFQKEFLKNVRARIKEIDNRDYINPSEGTLDFVLLFIPNEQVFAFIQEKDPELMDEALKKKVVLSSPFTLYAILAVIRQAHENFRFEKDMKKIIGDIDIFAKHFETFKGRFTDLGDLIQKIDRKYSDLTEKSFKNLDTKIRHIEDYKKGQGIAFSPEGAEEEA